MPTFNRTIVVIAGVSGTGKTTVGKLLAHRLGWRFADADELHPAANIAKMAAGQPLNDTDRDPWLEAIGEWIDDRCRDGEPGIVTCSALKRRYRDRIRAGRPQVRIVYLTGDPQVIAQRMSSRGDHFMKPTMLASQLSAVEEPGPDESVLTVSVNAEAETVAERIATGLDLPHSGPG
jgi:gluconokinase